MGFKPEWQQWRAEVWHVEGLAVGAVFVLVRGGGKGERDTMGVNGEESFRGRGRKAEVKGRETASVRGRKR